MATTEPPSRPDPVEEFDQWADDRGTPVSRPACNVLVADASAVTCYGLIRDPEGGFSGVLVGTTIIGGSGIADWVVFPVEQDTAESAPASTA